MRTILLSISSITAMEIVELTSNAFSLLTILLQLTIFALTVIKLWHDIKYHKFKSLESEEKKVEKRYPFLTSLLNLFKKTKF